MITVSCQRVSSLFLQHSKSWVPRQKSTSTAFPHTKHHYHSSGILSSSAISRIQSFKNDKDDALHFIISSDESSESNPTKIFSPALFLPKDGIDVTEGKEYNIEDPSSSSLSVRDEMITDISAIVESHYTLDNGNQFVGGMGENDGGVWFVADCNSSTCSGDGCDDTLDYWEHIRDVISSIKQNRHGIPFGIYTSGIIKDKDIANDLKGNLGISSVQVTLGSGDPVSYGQVVGIEGSSANSAFGEVCNFIVSSAESGFPVTAAVAGGKHTGPGSELAKALGAVNVVVYDI